MDENGSFNILSREGLFAITQSLLSIIVVLGAGYSILNNSPNSEILIGLAGTVLGYYFSRTATSVSGEASALRTLRKERAKIAGRET